MSKWGASASERRPLLEWLLLRYPDTPRSRAKQWVVTGRVRVGGKTVRKPHEMIADPGTGLELLERHATSLDLGTAQTIHPRVTLLHLDGSIAIINKGPGLLSIPGDTSELSALSIVADFLAGRLRARDAAIRTAPAAFRRLLPLPVHRLDKFTSGAFCLAMNPKARQQLLEQLRAHEIRREYLAFVEGRPVHSSGTWRHWLELSRDELRQRVVPKPPAAHQGRACEAVTYYEVLQEYSLPASRTAITKLRLRLATGLKHQIRVQAAAEGLPIVGDRTYNPHYRDGRAGPELPPFSRQALHAALIGLVHPDRSGEEMTWQAEPPRDLLELEATLMARGGSRSSESRRGPGTALSS